ncbi:hypothetical protein H0E87_006828 [Populus deltoides]|uniref:Ankyrin repeat family protein n=1 Tax=Populus deltoides TaxID=3696 RepID=A0A8T2Z8Q1_POPDE|nr:hypothetical protein H0E87_006828 [Populus deltoides]
MPQEASVAVSLRRNLSRRRSSRSVGDVDRDDRGWNLLHIGARKGDLKQVKRLLDEGMDVNVPAWGPKSKGLTPLHLAAQGGHLEIMAELLERGANIDARTLGACGCKHFPLIGESFHVSSTLLPLQPFLFFFSTFCCDYGC